MSAKWSKTPHTDRMYDKRTGSISEWTNKKRAMPLVIRFNATAKYFIHTINSIRLLAFILNYKCICVNFFELRADDAISIKASSVLLFIVSSRANGIAHHIRIFFLSFGEVVFRIFIQKCLQFYQLCPVYLFCWSFQCKTNEFSLFFFSTLSFWWHKSSLFICNIFTVKRIT